MKRLHLAGVTLLAVLLVCGCSQSDERRHPLFVQGTKARAAGDGVKARACFEKLLTRRPDATATLLELAGVCDELLDDQLAAALYYRRYLEAVPDAPNQKAIARWQETAEKKLYESWKARFGEAAESPVPAAALPDTATDAAASAAEVAELRQKLDQYRRRYTAIREEVARLRSERGIQVPAPATASAAPVSVPAASASALPDYYEVKPGDNPGKIAQKLYGDARKYPLLLQANPKVTAKNLKPGMKLIVPKP